MNSAQPSEGPSYEELCLEWRRSLPEAIVRSLAADYLRGIIEPCTTDAFAEYEYRFGRHRFQNKSRQSSSMMRAREADRINSQFSQ